MGNGQTYSCSKCNHKSVPSEHVGQGDGSGISSFLSKIGLGGPGKHKDCGGSLTVNK